MSVLWDQLGQIYGSWISYAVSFYVTAQFWMIDRFADVPLFEDGRNQPPTPDGEDIFG